MARVRGFDRGTQRVKVHPTEVDCFHQTIRSSDGTVYLHLTTFGSDERSSHPKSSQSLQLDEARARQLLEVLRQAFPHL